MRISKSEKLGFRRASRMAGTCVMAAAVASMMVVPSAFADFVANSGYGCNPSSEIVDSNGIGTMPVAGTDQAYNLDEVSQNYIIAANGGSGTASIDYIDIAGLSNVGEQGYNWGTKINENPNPFSWNQALGAFTYTGYGMGTDATDATLDVGMIKDTWSGIATYALVDKYRPDVLTGRDSSASETYQTIVQMINTADGNTSYSPKVFSFSQTTGLGYSTMSDLLWSVAGAVEDIQKDNPNKKTRYQDESAGGLTAADIAQRFEGLTKGLQWYILSKVENTSSMKKIAIVTGYADGTYTAVACNNDSDYDMSAMVKDYEPYEQITKNACLENNGWTGTLTDETDKIEAYDSFTTTDPKTAFSGVDYVIYAAGRNATVTASDIEKQLSDAGVTTKVISPNLACTSRGFGFTRNIIQVAGFLYPELFNVAYGEYYWWKNFAHVKDEYIEAVMQAVDANQLLPIDSNGNNITLSTEGYSESYINDIITQGEEYYQANKDNSSSNCSHWRLQVHNNAKNANYPDADYSDNNYQFGYFSTSAKSQSIKVSPATKTIKASKLKKKAKSFNVTVKNAKTSLTAKAANSKSKKALSVKVKSKKKVTIKVKKGTKKGTYKVTIQAKKSSTYKASAKKTVTIKVK